MNIKVLLYIIIILLGIIFNDSKGSNEIRRKWYVFIIITILILESSLRSVSVGPDTLSYYYSFQRFITEGDWAEILSSFRRAYIEGEGKDAGYLVFMKLVQVMSTNFNFYLFICALVFFVPLGFILYRYSTNILQLMFAFSLYVALFHIVALSGIRQQVATGFAFMAFLQLDKNQYWKAFFFIILGSLIHISLLIFLLVPIIRITVSQHLKRIHLYSFFIIPFVIVYSRDIMTLLASFLVNEYYLGYSESETINGAYTYVVLMELLSLFCYIAIKKQSIDANTKTGLLYTMLPLLTMTAPLISLDGALIRVGQYFTLYMMLLIPMAIDAISRSTSRNIIYFSFIIILFILGFGSGFSRYYFFWQEPQI